MTANPSETDRRIGVATRNRGFESAIGLFIPGKLDAASWRGFGVWVDEFNSTCGAPEENPGFWATTSPNSYLANLSGPIQLHHSTTDEMVPPAWAETLDAELTAVSVQPHELYTYPGDNHNISANFDVAMQRTVAFFDIYVKGQ